MRHKFGAQLEHSPNVHVKLARRRGVVARARSASRRTVAHLESLLDGREWAVRSRCFVLACGTIENARILLNSNRQIEGGVGNGHDWVGRCLMDHPKGIAGTFVADRAAPHGEDL